MKLDDMIATKRSKFMAEQVALVCLRASLYIVNHDSCGPGDLSPPAGK
jgi:hypothetical protein